MPLIAASAIGAGGSLASGLLGYFGSQSAARQQQAAANRAIGVEQQQFGQTQQNLAPYMQAGGAGLNQLQALLGLGPQGAGGQQAALAATPGYQFTLDQGLSGLQNQLAARGGAAGGNALKALMGYGQGLASQNFQQAVGNASGLAGLGKSAATQTGQFGAGTANSIASLLGSYGNAGAAGTMSGVNALAGGLGGISQNALQYLLLQQLNQGGGGGAAAFSPNNINLTGASSSTPALGIYGQ